MRNTVRVLTIQEEKDILASLAVDKDLYIANGASRLVYNCSDDAAKILDVDAEDYVIKVAIGVAGVNQNSAEIEFAMNHDYAPIADIKAYGRFIEVMEKVEVERDYRDFAEDISDDLDDAIELGQNYYDLDEDEAEEAFDVITSLHDYFGHTSDNGQLGRTRNGDLVAFDYGFICGGRDDGGKQVSNLDYFLEDDNYLRKAFLNGLIRLIQQSEAALDRYEDLFAERARADVDPNIDEREFSYYCIFGIRENGKLYSAKYKRNDSNLTWDKENYCEKYVIYRRNYRTEGLESEAELISEEFIESNMTEQEVIDLMWKIALNGTSSN